MPLSEHEQRLLEQLERQLSAEDPKFASAMNGAHRASGAGRRLVIGGTALVAGLALTVVGVAQSLVPLGLIGFLVMLAGTIYALSAQRRSGPVGVVDASGRATSRPHGRRTGSTKARRFGASGSFMQRMEQRWERRKGGGSSA